MQKGNKTPMRSSEHGAPGEPLSTVRSLRRIRFGTRDPLLRALVETLAEPFEQIHPGIGIGTAAPSPHAASPHATAALRLYMGDAIMARGVHDHVVRPIAPIRLGLYGHPDYLARRGEPRAPVELSGHDVRDIYLGGASRPVWLLCSGRDHYRLDASDRRCSDVPDLIEQAVTGECLSWLPNCLAQGPVATGSLRAVLPRWSRQSPIVGVLVPRKTAGDLPELPSLLEFLASAFDARPAREA